MTACGLLLSAVVNHHYGAQIDAIAAEVDVPLRRLETESAAKFLDCVTAAFFSRDLFSGNIAKPDVASSAFFEIVNAAPRLRWLQVFSSGLDLPLYAPSLARGVNVTNSAGTTALPIAQSVAAAVLAQSRGFGHWLGVQRQRCWTPLTGTNRPRDLEGQRVVVVGTGPIGMEIGRLLGTLGFHTTAIRQRAVPTPHFDQSLVVGQLDELLPTCDWLVLACPLTDRTHGLINARRLDLLPSHARVANVGRGELLDEVALEQRLLSGRLAGAFLDVFSQEPLASESPLWDLPQVWITPHNCAASLGHEDRIVKKFMTDLRLWLVNSGRSSQPTN